MPERQLDQLIDAALPSYLAEPPAGLPGRIVARVYRSRRWPWAAGLAAAAALAVAVLAPKPHAVEAPPLVAVHAGTAPQVRFTRNPEVRRPAARRRLPITARERALLQFARTTPELFHHVLVEAPRQMNLDLTIEPLVIEPLSTGGE